MFLIERLVDVAARDAPQLLDVQGAAEVAP